MKKQINEIRRMQQLAGILKENETIDRILDKISSQGEDSLTKLEKDYLSGYSLGKTNLLDPYDEANIRLNEKKSFLSFVESNYDKILDLILKNDFNNDIISFIKTTNVDKQHLVTGKWNNYIDKKTSLDSVETIYGEIGKNTPLDFSEVLIAKGEDISYDEYLKDQNISPSLKNMFSYLEKHGDSRSIIISNYSAKDVGQDILGDPNIESKPIPTVKYKNKPIHYRIVEYGLY